MRLMWTILGFAAFISLPGRAQVQTPCPLTQAQIIELKGLDLQITARSQEFQTLLDSENALKKELAKAGSHRYANTDWLNVQLDILLEKGSIKYAELANLQISRDQLQDFYCRQNHQSLEAKVRPDLKSHPRRRVQR
jgi:hypothetical protein